MSATCHLYSSLLFQRHHKTLDGWIIDGWMGIVSEVPCEELLVNSRLSFPHPAGVWLRLPDLIARRSTALDRLGEGAGGGGRPR